MPGVAAGIYAADASRDAARIQARSGQEAITNTRQLADRSRADLQPWVNSGNDARSILESLLRPGGQLTQSYGQPYSAPTFNGVDMSQDPGVQYRFQQANKGFETSAAARGRSLGGGAIKSLAELNQNLASQEFGNAYGRQRGQFENDRSYGFNADQANRGEYYKNQDNLFSRLFGISGQGQASAAGQAQQGLQTGQSLAELITGIGNANAAGKIGAANAIQTGVQNDEGTLASIIASASKSKAAA